MPSSKPNAWCVVMITIGLTIGAATRNASVSAGPTPLMIRPRANGTLPHSHTGMTMPTSESTARRAHAARGMMRSITPDGTHTCITIESTTPSMTNGSASISTLSEKVSSSCSLVGSGSAKMPGANTAIATRQATTAMPTAGPFQRRVRTLGGLGHRASRAAAHAAHSPKMSMTCSASMKPFFAAVSRAHFSTAVASISTAVPHERQIR